MDQIEMINVGTVFHFGPVVDLIVDNLPLVDKFCLLAEIEIEDEMRPPGTSSPMAEWQVSIKRALRNQRVFSSVETEDVSLCEMTEESNVVPSNWLANEETFERFLLLCPNLTAIHLVEHNEEMLDMIRRLATNLTTLELEETDDSMWPTVVQIINTRKGQMEFIDVERDCINSESSRQKLPQLKEWIEENPNLTAIGSGSVQMDFVRKTLCVDLTVLPEWTQTGTVSELCSFFETFNSCYQKSSSNGIKLIELWGLDLDSVAICDDLVENFRQLEFLNLQCDSTLDVNQLKVMANLRGLDLQGDHLDESQCADELLSHLHKLEQLYLEDVLVTETAIQQLHVHCPNLRRLAIKTERDIYELSDESLREICRLKKLECFRFCSPKVSYDWPNRRIIEKKRRKLARPQCRRRNATRI